MAPVLVFLVTARGALHDQVVNGVEARHHRALGAGLGEGALPLLDEAPTSRVLSLIMGSCPRFYPRLSEVQRVSQVPYVLGHRRDVSGHAGPSLPT